MTIVLPLRDVKYCFSGMRAGPVCTMPLEASNLEAQQAVKLGLYCPQRN